MRTHSIKNQNFEISVQEIGAELCSFKNLKTGVEHIWQANSEIWGSHAPNLFPIIGILKNGQYYFEDETYSLPKHGFVRHNTSIQLKEKSKNSLVFELMYSEETLKLYPFRFNYKIAFELNENQLHISHNITNLDKKTMYFSLGGHPAFNVPISKGENYEDYYLKFDQKLDLKTHLLNENGLVSDETKAVLKDEDELQLHKELFRNDALIFKNILSKKLALKSKNSGTILSVEYSDFKNLGLWAKPDAPYVCIEPWLGIADLENSDGNLTTKEGVQTIAPKATFTASYTIISHLSF